MKRRAKRMIRKAATVVIVSAVGFCVAQIPAENWIAAGKEAALAAAGSRQPESGVQLLESRLFGEEKAANATVPSVFVPPLGTGIRETLTTQTTAAQVKTGKGKVVTQLMSAGSAFVQGVAINNKSGKAVDIAAALSHKPKLSFSKKETKPQVLITHTHTTECYLSHDDGTYANSDLTRTNDATKNVVAVGEKIAVRLRQAGIGVVHDTVIHDNPYNGAYGRSKEAVQAALKKYPTIRVVLDIHRDAIYPSDGSRVKPTAVIDGKKTAQVMIIVGMLNTKSAPNTHTAENLAFAVRLQQKLHTDYPTFARPLTLANARYNQQLSNGSILIEMGSDANTLEEALRAGELVGKELATVLWEL